MKVGRKRLFSEILPLGGGEPRSVQRDQFAFRAELKFATFYRTSDRHRAAREVLERRLPLLLRHRFDAHEPCSWNQLDRDALAPHCAWSRFEIFHVCAVRRARRDPSVAHTHEPGSLPSAIWHHVFTIFESDTHERHASSLHGRSARERVLEHDGHPM